jgi:ABC-type branched-subunit amino acid transport system substrate-binding protein
VTRCARIAVTFILLGALTALAACSSGGSSDQPATAGLSASPIEIGVPTVENSQIYTSPEVQPAAEAAVAAVNAAGGINGHPLVAVVCDGQLNPTQEAQCAEEWAHDGVAAVTGGVTPVGTGVALLESARIPWIDGTLGTSAEVASPDVFAVGAAGPGTTAGMAKALVAGGATKMGILTCAESSCDSSVTEFDYGARKNDVAAPEAFRVPNATVDYSSVIAQVLQSHVNGLAMLYTPDGADQIITQLRQAGYKGVIAGNATAFTSSTLANLTAQYSAGLRIVYSAVPGTDTQNPEIKALTAAMKKTSPTAPVSDLAVYTYASIKIFAKIAQGLSKVTSATVLAALQALKTPANATSVSPPFAGAGPTPFGAPLNLRSVHSDDVWLTVVKNGVPVGDPGKFVPAFP